MSAGAQAARGGAVRGAVAASWTRRAGAARHGKESRTTGHAACRARRGSRRPLRARRARGVDVRGRAERAHGAALARRREKAQVLSSRTAVTAEQARPAHLPRWAAHGRPVHGCRKGRHARFAPRRVVRAAEGVVGTRIARGNRDEARIIIRMLVVEIVDRRPTVVTRDTGVATVLAGDGGRLLKRGWAWRARRARGCAARGGEGARLAERRARARVRRGRPRPRSAARAQRERRRNGGIGRSGRARVRHTHGRAAARWGAGGADGALVRDARGCAHRVGRGRPRSS